MFRMSVVVDEHNLSAAYAALKVFGVPEIVFIEDADLLPAVPHIVSHAKSVTKAKKNGVDNRSLRAPDTYKGKREGGRGIKDITAEVIAAQKTKFFKAHIIADAMLQHGFSKNSSFYGIKSMIDDGVIKMTKARGVYEIIGKKK